MGEVLEKRTIHHFQFSSFTWVYNKNLYTNLILLSIIQ